MLEKARSLACDTVVLDLEDSVAPELKGSAREAVMSAIETFAGREVVVRINALSTPYGCDDLKAVRQAAPDAVLLSKVEGAADIAAARDEGGSLAIWAMIETPLAVLNLAAIAAGGVAHGLECLVMGANDLLKTMRGQPLFDRHNLWAAMSMTVIAARAYSLGVIDGTYNEIGDELGFAESCGQGRAFGFDGKTLIHPSQIETCNRIFAPSQAEIAQAKRVLEAFARNPGKGAIALDGRMVERLHAEEATRILALAGAIEGRA